MEIKAEHVYSNGKPRFKGREEVLVKGIDGSRVSYRKVTGWSFGWPSDDGINRSMSRRNFESSYPVAVEYVE